MNNIKLLSDNCADCTALEHEDRMIAEAINLLHNRLRAPQDDQEFSSVKTAQDYLCLRLAERGREVFCCMFLDHKHRLISYQEMFLGTIAACSVYPREVVKAALHHNASAIIFAHNHPSGDAEPSQADERITRILTEILVVIDVRVLDHLIIGDGEPVSFASRGLL